MPRTRHYRIIHEVRITPEELARMLPRLSPWWLETPTPPARTLVFAYVEDLDHGGFAFKFYSINEMDHHMALHCPKGKLDGVELLVASSQGNQHHGPPWLKQAMTELKPPCVMTTSQDGSGTVWGI
jgi:hypothetical protein